MTDYELMDEEPIAERYSWWRLSVLMLLSVATTVLVYFVWSAAYDEKTLYPPLNSPVPDWWYRRAHLYANSVHDPFEISHDFRLTKNQTGRLKPVQTADAATNASSGATNPKALGERDIPSASSKGATLSVASGASTVPASAQQMRLVCYYSTPDRSQQEYNLSLSAVAPQLCSHINIGLADVQPNATLALPADLRRVLRDEAPQLRAQNPDLRLLLWVGGGDTGHEFAAMVRQHSTRKIFIQSLTRTLREYALDGVDLDWEFPSAYKKERQHFSQLLYEIRQEYKRERRAYLLSVAVAAPEGIALFAYDVAELNKYADYVNLMTYDYHFYARNTPFTGLNSPLYARANEHSILATLNVNYSVNWWLTNGLDRRKLVVGLATYGHSFTLVNPFNSAIGAPAEGIGRCGSKGFTTYSEICWFNANNLIVAHNYDQQTCSPYLSSGTEWISYENEVSVECKARYAKSLQLGGVMVFSLNTDDFKNYCKPKSAKTRENATFPLIEKIKSVISGADIY